MIYRRKKTYIIQCEFFKFECRNWSNISIKDELQTIFNIPVTIDNGANSAVLANYINLLNPELIVLSGPLVYNSDLFYEAAVQTALKKINTRNVNMEFSKGGQFKEYAMAVGSAVMVVENSLH